MPERDETFWINACLHLIFCEKGVCQRCMAIREAVEEDKPDMLNDFTWASGPTKETRHED